MKDFLFFLACIAIACISVIYIIDPRKSLTLSLDHRLFYRGSEPTEAYFLVVRIISVLALLISLTLAVFIVLQWF